MISGFRREVEKNYALLGSYAASSGNFLPTYREKLSVVSSKVKNSWLLKDGAKRMSRNVGKELPLNNFSFIYD
jgi:hypothetical protein